MYVVRGGMPSEPLPMAGDGVFVVVLLNLGWVRAGLERRFAPDHQRVPTTNAYDCFPLGFMLANVCLQGTGRIPIRRPPNQCFGRTAGICRPWHESERHVLTDEVRWQHM